MRKKTDMKLHEKAIKYKMIFIDSIRFIASFSNIAENLAENVHKMQ